MKYTGWKGLTDRFSRRSCLVNKGVTAACGRKPQREDTRMKKSVLLLLVAGLFAATPVLAVGKDSGQPMAGDHVQRCVLQNEAIGEKIQRLQQEVKEGKKTYSAEELRKVEEKLKEANFMLDQLNHP